VNTLSVTASATGSAKLARLTELVANQVSHWSEARWGSLGDALYDVIQGIAGPDHPVPRLGAMALPDQLRVVVTELLREGDGARIDEAAERLAFFRGVLIASQ
jgi:hypothetical protein